VSSTDSTLYGMSTLRDSDIGGPSPHHDERVNEMASMLLADTTIDQSQAAAPKLMSGIPSQDTKAIPQLSRLLYNGDDAWAMKVNPVMTAASKANENLFSGNITAAGNDSQKLPSHSRNGSAPPIPRKSSKRKSARPPSTYLNEGPELDDPQFSVLKSKKLARSSISHTNHLHAPQAKPSTINALDVNSRIEAMVEATRALKPGVGDSMLQGSGLPTKKRRFKDSNVLMKMKTAINDRFQVRTRKYNDPARDNYLLDDTLNEAQMPDEGMSTSNSALSTLEIRMNEG
jgi:hypothetical protein